jgi:hypothetical protein
MKLELTLALVLLSLGWLALGYILGRYSVYRKLRTRTKDWLD